MGTPLHSHYHRALRQHPSAGFFGIEKLHPFDSQKFRRIVAALQREKLIAPDQVGLCTRYALAFLTGYLAVGLHCVWLRRCSTRRVWSQAGCVRQSNPSAGS